MSLNSLKDLERDFRTTEDDLRQACWTLCVVWSTWSACGHMNLSMQMKY